MLKIVLLFKGILLCSALSYFPYIDCTRHDTSTCTPIDIGCMIIYALFPTYLFVNFPNTGNDISTHI